MAEKPVKLTKTMATIIAVRYFPRPKLAETKGPCGERTYKAGNGYMDITITNDWVEYDGLISVCLSNSMGDGSIYIKLDPKTLEPVDQPGRK